MPHLKSKTAWDCHIFKLQTLFNEPTDYLEKVFIYQSNASLYIYGYNRLNFFSQVDPRLDWLFDWFIDWIIKDEWTIFCYLKLEMAAPFWKKSSLH